MKINVLRKGDKVLNITSEFLAIQRKNGEVDILPITSYEHGVRIETEQMITVGFGDNTVESESIDGVVITTF